MAIPVCFATLPPLSRTNPSLTPSISFSASNSTFFNNTLTQNIKASQIAVLGRPRNASGLSCTCLFGLGVPELAVIAGVAALLFGPKQLPEVGRSIGKTVRSFQQAAKEFETELKKEPDSPTEVDAEKSATTAIEVERQENKISSSAKES
ncbi:sec-independent protein translocase protein TATA, chloroplastic [Impatiens glandulifera]|uniref:sec-independent protein translocase protein TATA, chloroplastic n=1 Tax=Impatiens glandulifera TaxID=253017 RepID=UPI001FB15CE4|nr:sec-independent protein translocase protein TATA, chloroplastic [Impatiens glandulifera]